MILTCNSCGKKFVVPDAAITATGRNPRTGESIQIPASKKPKFLAGKQLKELIKSTV